MVELAGVLVSANCTNKKGPPSRVSLLLFGGAGGSRTRVRKTSAFGSTCVSQSIDLTVCYPTGREDRRRFR